MNFADAPATLTGMDQPTTPLPPFAALRAFHAAVVHGRFRDAAERLGVTESAISHQVRQLVVIVAADHSDVWLCRIKQGPEPVLKDAGLEIEVSSVNPEVGFIHASRRPDRCRFYARLARFIAVGVRRTDRGG